MALDKISVTPGVNTHLDVDNLINLTIDAVNDLQGGTTNQILKKASSTDFDFELANSILPDATLGNMQIKKIAIGDWNMDSTSQVTVAHGLDYSKISHIEVKIFNDFYDGTGNGVVQNLVSISPAETGTSATRIAWNSTVITLTRSDSGYFDNSSFDATSFNRGYIYITYEV